MANGAFAVPTITIDKVAQRWPWNNKVDIAYTISEGGQNLANGVYRKINFEVNIPGQASPVVIDGSDDVIAPAKDGQHTITWTPPSDLAVRADGCTVTAKLYETDGDYMIIDLDTGKYVFDDLAAGATPAERQANSNARYNTALYKGTNGVGEARMVLRRIPKGGTYQTGDDTNFGISAGASFTNSVKSWTTDRDFFVGVFQFTAWQYKKFFSSEQWPGLAPKRIFYDKWRAGKNPSQDLVADAASTSPIERLIAKTGLKGFDLPTEVMYEIAARAGSTSIYFSPLETVTSASNIGSYYVQGQDNPVAVGGKRPNSWGFYDMCANHNQLCRDGASRDDMADAASPFDPAGDGASDRIMAHGASCGAWVLNSNYTNNKAFYTSCRSKLAKTGNDTYGPTARIAWHYVGE